MTAAERGPTSGHKSDWNERQQQNLGDHCRRGADRARARLRPRAARRRLRADRETRWRHHRAQAEHGQRAQHGVLPPLGRGEDRAHRGMAGEPFARLRLSRKHARPGTAAVQGAVVRRARQARHHAGDRVPLPADLFRSDPRQPRAHAAERHAALQHPARQLPPGRRRRERGDHRHGIRRGADAARAVSRRLRRAVRHRARRARHRHRGHRRDLAQRQPVLPLPRTRDGARQGLGALLPPDRRDRLLGRADPDRRQGAVAADRVRRAAEPGRSRFPAAAR